MTTITTKEDLERAAGLLQRAHDWIERYGFNIRAYGTQTRARAEQYDTHPAMCYIGTLRFLADPDLAPNPDESLSGDPSEGDGPELALALAKLDEIAQSHIRYLPHSLREKAGLRFRLYVFSEDEQEREVDTGRFIEHLGFLIAIRAEENFPDPDWSLEGADRAWSACRMQRQEYQRDYALKILRKALTEIHS